MFIPGRELRFFLHIWVRSVFPVQLDFHTKTPHRPCSLKFFKDCCDPFCLGSWAWVTGTARRLRSEWIAETSDSTAVRLSPHYSKFSNKNPESEGPFCTRVRAKVAVSTGGVDLNKMTSQCESPETIRVFPVELQIFRPATGIPIVHLRGDKKGYIETDESS